MRKHPLLLLTAAAIGLPAVATPGYNVLDITPTGYSSATAFDINSSGDAVGVTSGTPGTHFFFYDHSLGTSTVFGVGTITPRDPFLGAGHRNIAINDSGLIVGTARFDAGVAESRGFIYNGSTITSLGTLTPVTGPRPSSDAMDVNSSGLVTGTATSGAGTTPQENDNIDAYTGTGSPISDHDGDLTTATRYDWGLAINNQGEVVGRNGDGKATLYVGTGTTVLLAATGISGDSTKAIDLNEVDQVLIENSSTSSTYLYNTSSTALTLIPQIGSGNRMFGKGINEDGDAVGWGDRSAGTSGQGRGWLYDESDNTSYILEDVSNLTTTDSIGFGDWESLGTAWAINDSGWIVGEGDRRATGQAFPNDRAYLLIPVPEPSSLALLALGGTALIRRRS